MPTHAVRGLKVVTLSHRPMIFVPTLNAQSLRAYLQTKGISSSPPADVTGDTSSLELRPRTDLGLVQGLLEQWGKPQKTPAV